MANGHGGARPGAGRKKGSTVERQVANRGIVLAAVDQTALEGMVKSLVAAAQEGDHKAFSALAPYLLGAPQQDLTIHGDTSAPLEIVIRRQ